MKVSTALVAALLPLSAFAQPAFSVDGPTDKAYAAGDPTPVFVLAAQFDPANTSVAAEVTAFKLPSGRSPSNRPCALAGPTAGPLANRVTFAISIEPGVLVAPGEYACSVRFDAIAKDGRSVSATTSKELKIQRVEASLSARSLGERTVMLERTYPGASASRTVPWEVAESTGQSAVTVAVKPGPLIRSGTTRLGDGDVEVQPPEQTLSAGKPKTFSIELDGFDAAGTFETELSFESTAFSAPKTAKLKVEVKDHWFWPLVAILLGVCGGGWVNRWVKQSRPAIATRVEALAVNERARVLEPSVESADDSVAFQQLGELLAEVDRQVALGNAQDADTALTTATSKLSTLETGIFKALVEQKSRFEKLRESLGETKQSRWFRPNVLAAVDDQLEQATLEVDEAATLVEVKPVATSVKVDAGRDALVRAYEAKRDALLQPHPNPDAGAQSAVQQLSEALKPKEPLKIPDFAAARAALSELDAALNPPAAKPLQAPIAASAPAPGPAPRIEIVSPPEERRAGSPIVLQLVDLPAGPEPPVHWKLGDGHVATGTRVPHTFNRPGTYGVEAAYGGGSISIELRVMPSDLARQQAALITALRRNDRILLAIAAALAAATGLSQLYVDQLFGSLTDYIVALIWGFGIERSARGFATIFTAIKA